MDKTILVVDDDEATVRMLAALIRGLGYQVATAISGPKALEWMTTHTPDLIISDMMMPDMDGLSIIRIIRREPRFNGVPAIIFSAICDETFRNYALSEGANDCWLKANFDYASLPEHLSRLTNANPPPNQ